MTESFALGGLDLGMPLALAGLFVLPLLALAVAYEARRRREADARYRGAPALRLGRSTTLRALRVGLLLGAVALLAIAFARPRWGAMPVPLEQRGVEVVIVLDVSRSMLAADLPPSRAQGAAQRLTEMLSHLEGNRVGLVTFAGSAFERSPLTLDLAALSVLVNRAQQESALVRPGTDLRVALETALGMLQANETGGAQAIVLVSDGEDLGGDIAPAIRRANDREIPIYSVFAATTTAIPLPAASGGTDVTRGDRTVLDRVASETGGDLRELRAVPGLAVEFRRLRQTRFDTQTREARIERFPWFLGGAIALLLIHELLPASSEGRTRRGWPAAASRRRTGRRRAVATGAAAAAMLLVGCAGTAAYRHVQAGNDAYADGRYDPALEAYRAAIDLQPNDVAINYNIANTLHRLARYDEALTTAEQALEAATDGAMAGRLLYTIGSTAYMREDLPRAREALEAVLRRDPADREAKANLELVLRALNPPEQPDGQSAPQPGEGEQEPGPPQPGQPGQPQPGQPGGTPQPGQPSGSPQPGSTPGQPGGSTTAEETRAALEAALAELGPEVTPDQARRILELARQANDLQQLSPGQGRGVPPR